MFVGTFSNLWEATISFVSVPVCLYVRMEQLGYLWTDFYEIGYLRIFFSVEEIKVSLKSDKFNRYFTWRPVSIYDISLRAS